MGRPVGDRSYESVEAFYSDPERWMSAERDLGLRWVGADGASYRAAWIARTEELYCVRYRTPDGEGGTVEVLGCLPASSVDRALSGWTEVCGEPRSYEWLRARARRRGSRARRGSSHRARVRSRTRAAH